MLGEKLFYISPSAFCFAICGLENSNSMWAAAKYECGECCNDQCFFHGG